MHNVSKAGDVYQELFEVEKLQKAVDSYWTISTNTCGEIYTVICC